MRIKIQGKDVEVRVQERRVVFADFMIGGKVVASGEAICAPQDIYSPEEGKRIAVERAAKLLEDQQLADRKQSLEEILKFDQPPQAIQEIPTMRSADSITKEVMNKLDRVDVKKLGELLSQARHGLGTAIGRRAFGRMFPGLYRFPPPPIR